MKTHNFYCNIILYISFCFLLSCNVDLHDNIKGKWKLKEYSDYSNEFRPSFVPEPDGYMFKNCEFKNELFSWYDEGVIDSTKYSLKENILTFHGEEFDWFNQTDFRLKVNINNDILHIEMVLNSEPDRILWEGFLKRN